MSACPRIRAAPNPFRSSQVRPGAVPFLFPPGLSAPILVEKLRSQGWCGEISGPEGSGKSTLLAALAPDLLQAGRDLAPITLHCGQRQLPPLERPLHAGRTLLVIDGYDQLSWWQRLRLKWLCRRNRYGLLVTTHQPGAFPNLYQTCVSDAMARQVVKWLTASSEWTVNPAEVSKYLASREGNLREALFDLYDLFESRRPRHTSQSPTG